MKYEINDFDELIIYNDSDKRIFVINKLKYWFKFEYGDNGKVIYREDLSGLKIFL